MADSNISTCTFLRKHFVCLIRRGYINTIIKEAVICFTVCSQLGQLATAINISILPQTRAPLNDRTGRSLPKAADINTAPLLDGGRSFRYTTIIRPIRVQCLWLCRAFPVHQGRRKVHYNYMCSTKWQQRRKWERKPRRGAAPRLSESRPLR